MKILSVIIPVYNTDKYLDRCIRSVIIPEILDEIEILIINDGSTDGSLAIAQKYQIQYPEVIKVIDKPNGGKGSCMNIGLEIATGKYFRELDSDDFFFKKAFVQFVEELKKTDTDVVITQYSVIDVDENVIKFYDYSGVPEREILNLDIFTFEDYDVIFTMHSVTHKTQVFKCNGIRFQEKVSFTDAELVYFGFLYSKDMCFIPCNLYQYFLGRVGASMETVFDKNKINRKKNQEFVIAKRLLNTYNNMHSNLSLARKKNLITSCGIVYTLYNRLLTSFDKTNDEAILNELNAIDYCFVEALRDKCRFYLFFNWHIPYYKLWKQYHIVIGKYISFNILRRFISIFR